MKITARRIMDITAIGLHCAYDVLDFNMATLYTGCVQYRCVVVQ